MAERLAARIRRTFDVAEVPVLNLDEVRPEEFAKELDRAAGKEHVVAEMYYGDGHTTNPSDWLGRFAGYDKVSIVLRATIQTCFNRVNSPSRSLNYPDIDTYRRLVYDNHTQQRDEFSKKAGIVEKVINTEGRTADQVAARVFGYAYSPNRSLTLLQPKVRVLYLVARAKKLEYKPSEIARRLSYPTKGGWLYDMLKELIDTGMLEKVSENGTEYLRVTKEGRKPIRPLLLLRASSYGFIGMALIPLMWGLMQGYLGIPITTLALLLTSILLLLFARWLYGWVEELERSALRVR